MKKIKTISEEEFFDIKDHQVNQNPPQSNPNIKKELLDWYNDFGIYKDGKNHSRKNKNK
jgi:hypothetical protein